MTTKMNRLIDPGRGLMECTNCGQRSFANLKEGGKYYRGSWQCVNGCNIL